MIRIFFQHPPNYFFYVIGIRWKSFNELQMPILLHEIMLWIPGGRLNKKDGLTRYGDSHVKDKTS